MTEPLATCKFAHPCYNPVSTDCQFWAFCKEHCTCEERRERINRNARKHYWKKKTAAQPHKPEQRTKTEIIQF